MAAISSVHLETLSGAPVGSQNIRVSGALTFDAGDVGKTYRLEIHLVGEDSPGDKRPPEDGVGDDALITFKFPFIFGTSVPYRTIPVSSAGTVGFEETRPVANEVLDEDAGKELVGWADIHTPVQLPRADEVYAKVSLSQVPVSKRSAETLKSAGV